ncbi:MAG: hypothetical protein COA79_18515 [Planctomycetota bacterium]|nr:MAG: hypothetical protein COA79_18515 [Planctomycetota bacterium]
MIKTASISLTKARLEILDLLENLRLKDKPYGQYNLSLNQSPDFYATCDAAIIRTIMGEDLKRSLAEEERQEWIEYINSYSNKDGIYDSDRHSEEHRYGTAMSALSPLGGQQKYPVSLYNKFNQLEDIESWLEKIDWSKQWAASHFFWGGMHCYSLSKHCKDEWKKNVFNWLDNELDSSTGWWRKGVPHFTTNEPLGGAAHIWPIYQHNNVIFPYPKQVIDSILALQKNDGSWISYGNYLDLDALYGLSYMSKLAPQYKTDEILAAVRKHGDLVIEKYDIKKIQELDMHLILAIVGEMGLLNQLDPERFVDDIQWSDIFSDIKLYNTKDVEAS